jgi:hypothetical protein
MKVPAGGRGTAVEEQGQGLGHGGSLALGTGCCETAAPRPAFPAGTLVEAKTSNPLRTPDRGAMFLPYSGNNGLILIRLLD